MVLITRVFGFKVKMYHGCGFDFRMNVMAEYDGDVGLGVDAWTYTLLTYLPLNLSYPKTSLALSTYTSPTPTSR